MLERPPPTASRDGEGAGSLIIIGVVVVVVVVVVVLVSFCWCGVTSPESGMMSWPSRPGSSGSGEKGTATSH